ncbi:RHS repeat domain-containing protein [Bacteroides bouchesdurhonensis]|uniref:RHS repeat domain-containing protein n=1 Tax=Bacteroides bouchesdurhonensis TaxID=1841855 RepID=UPI0022E500A9|nr:RHS repeat-associated core domain-containing protein [Bacteroides bouchesdurhonensis]
MSWKSGAETSERGYHFTYDGLSRLKDAIYGEGISLAVNPNRFNEQITGYDKMGNILGLKRYGQTSSTGYGLIDNLNLTYNGNQLQSVKDIATSAVYGNGTEFKDGTHQRTEYTYDKNGLIKDLNKNISNIQYNLLNLPSQVILAGSNSIDYEYGADGTKLRTVHKTGSTTLTTDYCGNAIYENGVLKMLLNEAGYVSFPDKKFHFYLKDHQGNTRVVADKDGNVEETNAYYPFGGNFTSAANTQPYKYNGKELDEKNGLIWYDYGARHYDAAIGRFTTIDPLLEDSYFVNPYAYCLNNPCTRVDPTGMKSRYNWEKNRYEDEDGNEVSFESVKEEYGIEEVPYNDIPPSDDEEVDGVTGATLIVPNYKEIKEIYVLREPMTGTLPFLPGTGPISLKSLKVLFESGKSLKGLGFNSFKSFKQFFGKAGDGMDWHHLVEQTPKKHF